MITGLIIANIKTKIDYSQLFCCAENNYLIKVKYSIKTKAPFEPGPYTLLYFSQPRVLVPNDRNQFLSLSFWGHD